MLHSTIGMPHHRDGGLSQSFETRNPNTVHPTTLHVSAALRASTTVFNELVQTSCRVQNREDSSRPIGILVATAVGGPSGHSNLIRVRLTDPTDPFFLYQLELVEDDYGRFKKDHQLNVDFHEFPAELSRMLHEVNDQHQSLMADGRSTTEYRLLFSVGASATAQLFVQELNRFKTTNILELHLNREGDVGQKTYLSEQFEYFQMQYYDSENQRKDQAIAMERTIADLRGALAAVEREKEDTEGQLRVDASQSESRLQRALLERQDEYTLELRKVRAASDEERSALIAKVDALTQANKELAASRDQEVTALQARITVLEQSEAALKGQLSVKVIGLDAEGQRSKLLEQQLNQVTDHRNVAQRSLNEAGLQIVQLTERLAAAERHSKERVEETHVLRQQAINDAETIRVLTDQTKERHAKLGEVDADLKKAHHIIGNQLQAAKQQKEKFAGVVQQLNDARYMLEQVHNKSAELEASMDKLRKDRTQLLEDIEGLKKHLHSVTDLNETLKKDLQSARDAVVHIQRHGAHSLTRHVGSMSSAPGGGIAPSTDLYRQYATNASTFGSSRPDYSNVTGLSNVAGLSSVAPTPSTSTHPLPNAGYQMAGTHYKPHIASGAPTTSAEVPTAYF